MLINGKKIADRITLSLKKRIRILAKKKCAPSLVVVLIGNNPASRTYVRMKGSVAKKIGLEFSLREYPTKITTKKLVSEIRSIQAMQSPSGMIVQLPLPKHIDTNAVLNAIDPARDIDCLTYENMGRLVANNALFIPPTAAAVMKILESLKVSFPGKNVTIIGVGALVGKPLAVLLINQRASVTTINSATKNINEKCRNADIIITAVGKQNTIRGDMVSAHAIVIDAGIDFTKDGSVVGDVNVAEVMRHAAAVTPTPGGVGPLTIACLLENTVIAAELCVQGQ